MKTMIRFLRFVALLALLAPSLSLAQSSHSITKTELEARVSKALQEAGAGDAVAATLLHPRGETVFDHHSPVTVKLGQIDYDSTQKRWESTAEIITYGRSIQKMDIAGTYQTAVEVPTLTRTLTRGSMIEAADVEYTNLPSTELGKSTVLSKNELVGMSVRRTIKAGEPVNRDQIRAEMLIRKGDTVQMHYKTPHMEIRATGEALENGVKNQTIKVKNTESGLTVQGVVESKHHIRIIGGNAW